MSLAKQHDAGFDNKVLVCNFLYVNAELEGPSKKRATIVLRISSKYSSKYVRSVGKRPLYLHLLNIFVKYI